MTATISSSGIASNSLEELLSDEFLEPFRARAGDADERNTYFYDDLEQLRSINYLAAAVPEERGGWGLNVAELARIQRGIAHFAPSTALAMSMHHYWVGIAAEFERLGDPSSSWILDEAAGGTVFAAGHAETGARRRPGRRTPSRSGYAWPSAR
jgi:alkylation response protein AidB-like acyl-CoA dehydrogenase